VKTLLDGGVPRVFDALCLDDLAGALQRHARRRESAPASPDERASPHGCLRLLLGTPRRELGRGPSRVPHPQAVSNRRRTPSFVSESLTLPGGAATG